MKNILKSIAIAVVILVIMVVLTAVIDYGVDMLSAVFPSVKLIFVICAIVIVIAYASYQIYIQKYK